jgi:hypothetical protein
MPDQPTQQPENPEKKSTYLTEYVKYSAFAFQLIALFVVFSLGGNWLDKQTHQSFPLFTLLGVAIALAVVFYLIFRLIKNNNHTPPDA